MTRRVRALLIGASTTNGAPPVPTAVTLVEKISKLLRERFDANAMLVTLVDGDARHDRVMKAFDSIRAEAVDDDLVVVLFAGHGIPASATRPFQAWALAGDDQFTDLELARALLAFEARIDTVVISATCYGQGMFKPGPQIGVVHPGWSPEVAHDFELHLQLQLSNKQRMATLGTALRTKSAPMVCISAAAKDEQVMVSVLDDFGAEIEAATRAGETYHELAVRFDAQAFTGRAFQVDARPAKRMNDRVLGPHAP